MCRCVCVAGEAAVVVMVGAWEGAGRSGVGYCSGGSQVGGVRQAANVHVVAVRHGEGRIVGMAAGWW